MDVACMWYASEDSMHAHQQACDCVLHRPEAKSTVHLLTKN